MAAISVPVLFANVTLAAPQNGHVVGGAGSITQTENTTTIHQNTDSLAIDWQSFDVGVDEQVTFVQPGQSSVALNRILSSNGSQIMGRIDANGRVILVNPNGIVFGKNAVVNVGGLLASGLQLNAKDFLNGQYKFEGIKGTDGLVINHGLLNASVGGSIALLGKRIENNGLISARLGRVEMAAGNKAVVNFEPSGLIGIEIEETTLAEELGDSSAIENNGSVLAEAGQILLNASTAKDVFTQVVSRGDQQIAKSVVVHDDGSFSLQAGGRVTNRGSLDASGEEGGGDVVLLGEHIEHSGVIRTNSQQGLAGQVELQATNTTELKENARIEAQAKEQGRGGVLKLLGQNVGLLDQSQLNVEGKDGGGDIYVGGGLSGKNSHLPNSEYVYFAKNAEFTANAVNRGSGGKVILFAENTLRAYGVIEAGGGKISGDGGFVETSGLKGFDIGSNVPWVGAHNGKGGEWLIDPYNIQIVAGDVSPIANGFYTPDEDGVSVVGVDDIITALISASSITIRAGTVGDQSGDIELISELNFNLNNADQNGSSDRTLKLEAGNDIRILGDIQASGDGGLNIHLAANLSNVDNNHGSISFSNSESAQQQFRINTNGGDLIIGSEENPGAYNVDFSNAIINLWGPDYGGAGSELEHLAPSGRLFAYAQNNITTPANRNNTNDQPFYIKGRERDGVVKLDLKADNDIVFNGWRYDNNPTESAPDGYETITVEENSQIVAENNGFTTLRLTAGNHIDINGAINLLYENNPAPSHQDRLNIILSAGNNPNSEGSVRFNNNPQIYTGGGDFTILRSAEINLQSAQLNTSSAYGPGAVDLTSQGTLHTGNLDFAYSGVAVTGSPQALRSGDLILTAGDTITLGDLDLTACGGLEQCANLIVNPLAERSISLVQAEGAGLLVPGSTQLDVGQTGTILLNNDNRNDFAGGLLLGNGQTVTLALGVGSIARESYSVGGLADKSIHNDLTIRVRENIDLLQSSPLSVGHALVDGEETLNGATFLTSNADVVLITRKMIFAVMYELVPQTTKEAAIKIP